MDRKFYKTHKAHIPGEHYYMLQNGLTVCHINLDEVDAPPGANTLDYQSNQQAISIAIIYGHYGWAFYDEDIPEKFLKPLFYARTIDSITQVVDNRVADIFTKHDLKKLQIEIEKLLENDTDSIFKLRNTIQYFNRKEYYEATLSLFSLIDAQSINFLRTTQVQGTKQGLDALSKAINIKFGEYLQLTETYESSAKAIKNELFEKLPQYMATKCYENDAVVYEIINLMYCFRTLFDGYSWEEEQELPAAINRNFALHGVYKQDEVKRYDYIKLLFLLRKLLRVFNFKLLLNKEV